MVGDLVKERLTGAIILVALIVLLVPELLTGPIKSAPPRTVAASAEESPLRSYTINLGDDARARTQAAQPESAAPQPLPAASAAPAAAPQPLPESAAPAPAQPSPADSAPLPAAPERSAAPPAPHVSGVAAAKSGSAPSVHSVAAKPGTKAATPPAAGSGEAGAWLVQLGSFASHDNAERLAQQLRSQGFAASVTQGSSGRHLYRVRVGPAHDRAAATQLQAKLKAAGHGGAVVPR